MPGERQRVVISAKVSRQERAIIEAAAVAENTTVAGFIARLVVPAAQKRVQAALARQRASA